MTVLTGTRGAMKGHARMMVPLGPSYDKADWLRGLERLVGKLSPIVRQTAFGPSPYAHSTLRARSSVTSDARLIVQSRHL